MLALLWLLLAPSAVAEPGGYLLLAPLHGHPTLVDRDGEVVHTWDQVSIAGELLEDGSLIGPARPREGVALGREFDALVHQAWSGEATLMEVPRFHHDLVMGDTLLVLTHEERELPALSRHMVADEVVRELALDGTPTGWTWSAGDHVDELGLSRAQRRGIRRAPGRHLLMPRRVQRALSLRTEWLHAIALETLPGDGLLLTSRHVGLVVAVDRASGEVLWTLGARHRPRLVVPHDAHLVPEGMPAVWRPWSRVLEIDPASGEVIWSYRHRSLRHRYAGRIGGSAQRLPSGHTLVCQGEGGRVFEVDADGQIAWELRWPDDLYRARWVPAEVVQPWLD